MNARRHKVMVSLNDLEAARLDELTAHLLTASAKIIGERWRFARPRGQRKPIDALTAAMTAVDVLVSKPTPRRSVYESRELASA